MSKIRLKKMRALKPSSQKWLRRHLNDPYVQKAQQQGWRSRAAFKLIDLNNRFRFLKPNQNVLDLGSAPGAWSQVLAHTMASSGHIVALDMQKMTEIPNVTFIHGDFTDVSIQNRLREEGPFHVICSDMAPSTTGQRRVDLLRMQSLLEEMFAWIPEAMAEGGTFLAKSIKGGLDATHTTFLKKIFARVHHVKPATSYADSSEIYIVCENMRKLEKVMQEIS